jgi:hypothetical protein
MGILFMKTRPVTIERDRSRFREIITCPQFVA